MLKRFVRLSIISKIISKFPTTTWQIVSVSIVVDGYRQYRSVTRGPRAATDTDTVPQEGVDL